MKKVLFSSAKIKLISSILMLSIILYPEQKINAASSSMNASSPPVPAAASAFGIGAIIGVAVYVEKCWFNAETFSCEGLTDAALYGGAFSVATLYVNVFGPVALGKIATALNLGDISSAGALSDGIVKWIKKGFDFSKHFCALDKEIWGLNILKGTQFHKTIYDDIIPKLQAMFDKINGAVTGLTPVENMNPRFIFPKDLSITYRNDIFVAVTFDRLLNSTETVEYVEFEYSTDNLNWLCIPGHIGQSLFNGRDLDASDGWGYFFQSGEGFAGIKKGQVYFRARAKYKAGNFSAWVQPEKPVQINNLYDHDFSIKNLKIDPANPINNQMTSVTFKIRNESTNNEAAGTSYSLSVDDNWQNTKYLGQLNAGQEADCEFIWQATEGPHNIKIKVALANDGNPGNDILILPVTVGNPGNLFVDGETAPVRYLTLKAGSSGSSQFKIHNTGSEDIQINAAAGGAQASWVKLNITNLKLNAKTYQDFPFNISVPDGTTPGSYSASVEFTYSDKTLTALLNFNIVDPAGGLFREGLQSGEIIIDAEGPARGIYFPSAEIPFRLDNDPQTSYGQEEKFPDANITSEELKTLLTAVWFVQATEEKEKDDSGIFISQKPSDKGKTFTVNVRNEYVDIYTWITSGTNTFKFSLTNTYTDKANVSWNITNTSIAMTFAKSVWTKNYSLAKSILDPIKENWNKGKITFTAEKVSKAGKLYLYNNGVKLTDVTISSAGPYSFTVSKSKLDYNNSFAIKPDEDDHTNVTIKDINLEISYNVGSPEIIIARSLSPDSIMTGQSSTVSVNLSNTGTAEAKDIEYIEGRIPENIVISGSKDKSFPSVQPSRSESFPYTVSSDMPGLYEFPGGKATYKNLKGDLFSVSSNPLILKVKGTLEMETIIDTLKKKVQDTISISVVLKESLKKRYMDDAVVRCLIKKPDTRETTINLICDKSAHVYKGVFGETGMKGKYFLQISAEHPYCSSVKKDAGLSFEITTGLEIIKAGESIPEKFRMFNNYPNPFNPSTTIAYELPELCRVVIRIHDISGRLVDEISEDEQAPGKYYLNWNKPLASGIYLCRIDARSVNGKLYSDVIKLMLVK